MSIEYLLDCKWKQKKPHRKESASVNSLSIISRYLPTYCTLVQDAKLMSSELDLVFSKLCSGLRRLPATELGPLVYQILKLVKVRSMRLGMSTFFSLTVWPKIVRNWQHCYAFIYWCIIPLMNSLIWSYFQVLIFTYFQMFVGFVGSELIFKVLFKIFRHNGTVCSVSEFKKFFGGIFKRFSVFFQTHRCFERFV